MDVKEEIWELTVPSRVSVTVVDSRGKERAVTAKGKGQRLRIMPDDRERAEERMVSNVHNPFRNGMLTQVLRDGTTVAATPDSEAMSDEDLAELFSLDGDDFRDALSALGEVNVRRLKALGAEVNAGIAQTSALDEYIQERYSVGGSMPSYDAMQRDRD